jgi:signal transduction histidine kinase/NO-binding membrane sensor protein with MHYT domain/ActR/RegA family two-component response regulator
LFRTLTCITQQHSPWLLAIAVLVCLVSAATTMRLYSHGRGLDGPRSYLWLAGGGASGGAGIWATHFVSMLAYQPGLPTGYLALGTLMSLVIAATGVTAGLMVAAKRESPLIGGAIVGVAIAAMHYVGMSAFRTEGFVTYDPAYVAVAVAAGVLFASLSIKVVSARRGMAGAALGTVLLVVAIVALHFVSMAAVTVVPNTNIRPPTSILPNQIMALVVGGLSGLIMICAATILLIETWNHRRTLAQLNSVIEAMPDGLAYLDARDRFLLWNAKYEATLAEFGFRPERGRRYIDCLPQPAGATTAGAADHAAFIAERLAHCAKPSSTREERSPAGRWIRIEENRTADGGRVAVVFDITTLKQTAHDLAVARDDAEAANRAKSEFLANMSHEIRTPLNGVLGVAEALALSRLDSRQSELVEIIRSSGQVLNRLLCDILDLARVESGALTLEPQPFNLAEAVRDVAQLSAVHASEKNIAFDLTIAPEAERLVIGDPVRLKQILTNLAANAVKFTETGAVGLEIVCQDDAKGCFCLVVRDTGCGFGPETKARLFGRFQQGDGAMNRRAGGSGLGLAIASQLTDLMGGELEADSVDGEGSVFTLRLTLPRATPAQAPEMAEPPTAVASERTMRVLVVDDNAHNRHLMQVLLDHFGAETGSAGDGQQAVDAWRTGAFDVVFMDMQMPVMDGLAATRAIREVERREGLDRTPIIFVSANAMPEHVEAARAAGGDAHIAKPVAAARMFEALSSLEFSAAA